MSRRLSLLLLGLSLAAGASGSGCGEGAPPPRAILLVVLDTLRADHPGSYGAGRPTSPELDDWARSGRVYDRALAPSPWTLPSFASLFTGELPSRHGAGVFETEEGERVGVGEQRREVARELTGTLRTLRSVEPPSPRRPVPLDPKTREQLRALGYME